MYFGWHNIQTTMENDSCCILFAGLMERVFLGVFTNDESTTNTRKEWTQLLINNWEQDFAKYSVTHISRRFIYCKKVKTNAPPLPAAKCHELGKTRNAKPTALNHCTEKSQLLRGLRKYTKGISPSCGLPPQQTPVGSFQVKQLFICPAHTHTNCA